MVPEIWSVTNKIFCHFGPLFTFFTTLTTRKIEISKNWKKTTGDIIILHKCNKNPDHMLYCSWDMVCNRCNCYFSFWAIFCPFTSLIVIKIKILQKRKKILEISSSYTSAPKIMIIMLYCSWDMARERCNYFSFWAIFYPFPT